MVHIIKVYFENSRKEQEIRRLAVTSDVSNFTHLLEKIQTVFLLPDAESLQIKWRDPENDFIHLSSNDELAQALANAEDGLLRLYICMKGDKSESTNIPKCSAPKDVHPFVVCDGCDKKIVGVRYKCLQCKNYDLCASCDAADKHPIHDMIKFVRPTYIPREWVFLGARKLWRSMFKSCPSNYFTYFEDEKAPNSENSSDILNVNFQAKCNTVPKSASSSSTDNASNSSTSEQPKNKSSPNAHEAQQSPLADFANLPRVFMDCLQNDFVDAPKLIHDGLNQVLKAVQDVVESNVCNPEFKKSRGENENETGSSTTNLPTQASKSPTVENPSTSASKQAPEISSPHIATTENVDSVMQTNNEESSAANANEDEIIVDKVAEKSSNPADESAASADGWTLLEGGDVNKMECSEGAVANPTEQVVEQVVAYPDLMEVEVNQESSRNYVQTSDPVIISALTTMRAMGFTNEGGWLERLLISKQGNINDCLDALYPSVNHQ